MGAQSSTGSNDAKGEDSGWKIAAKALDPGTADPVLHGTRHILEEDEPLCGNPHVSKGVESGRYHAKSVCYPVNSHDVCKSCGRIYLDRFGSNHDVFEKLPTFEKGEWVRVRTEADNVLTGRVKRECDEDSITLRFLRLVISDEPQRRWLYGTDDELKIWVREGEQPTFGDDDIGVESLSSIDSPTGNIDQRTEATLDQIETIAGTDVKNVMAVGSDIHNFHLNVRPAADLQELTERFAKYGYQVTNQTPGEERSGTNHHAVSLEAEGLIEIRAHTPAFP